MDLVGKTALVTGGAKRVGRGITLRLARAGANVVINYNSSADEALATAAEAEALGVGALPVQASVADYDQVGSMVDAAVDRFGRIDVLVNNASTFVADPLPTDDLACGTNRSTRWSTAPSIAQTSWPRSCSQTRAA